MKPVAVAVHGGSGTLLPRNISRQQEIAYRGGLQEALDAAWDHLVGGSDALKAVEAGARLMEDNPLFNAGMGSVFTADAGHELDAAIMCGRTRMAGAVAGLRTVRHPISLARHVMTDSRYVFLCGSGAEAFADTLQIERVEPSWFATDERRRQLETARSEAKVVMDHDGDHKFGTIGLVALDANGDLAAATSTGGLTNKRFGRVGDSPVIGAGTYADNATCAVSCTGYGEEFIRAVAAHDVAARMRYLGETLPEAASTVVMKSLHGIGGSGGLIAVDAKGNIALPFNTEGMYRAWRSSSGNEGIAIFREEG